LKVGDLIEAYRIEEVAPLADTRVIVGS